MCQFLFMPSTIAQIEIYDNQREIFLKELDNFTTYHNGELVVKNGRWMEVDGFGHSGLLYKIIDLNKKIENLRVKLVNQSFQGMGFRANFLSLIQQKSQR